MDDSSSGKEEKRTDGIESFDEGVVSEGGKEGGVEISVHGISPIAVFFLFPFS